MFWAMWHLHSFSHQMAPLALMWTGDVCNGFLLSLLHVSDVDARDGVDVVGGEAFVVVQLVGLLLLHLSVDIFVFHVNALRKPVKIGKFFVVLKVLRRPKVDARFTVVL